MKKSILFCTVALATLIGSCGKYEDGPSISLRSRTSRVAGDWKIKKATSDGTDITGFLSGLIYSYTKDGDFTWTWNALTDKGKWEFYDNDEKMIMTDESGDKDTVVITMLKNTEMHLKSLDGKDIMEFEPK
jgi:hypothetical protein